MKTTKLLLGGLLATVFALGGCSTTTTSQSQYSGFLSSYEGLSAAKTTSGDSVLRWVDPDFNVANYTQVIYQPIRFYPEPHSSERINQQTLQELLDYTNDRVSTALFSRLKPASIGAGPGTLAFRGAITGVDASTQGLKPYEVIPVALVVAGAMAASGGRSQNSELYLEAELVDTSTGKPVLRVVRKGLGKTLDNDKQVLTANDFKSVIDNLTRDILSFQ
jgi:hypothetical protein